MEGTFGVCMKYPDDNTQHSLQHIPAGYHIIALLQYYTMEDNYSLAGLMMLFSLRANPITLQKANLLLERENTIFFSRLTFSKSLPSNKVSTTLSQNCLTKPKWKRARQSPLVSVLWCC